MTFATPAAADVVLGGAGVNAQAPADDPGWANVGNRGGASAVYVGNQWVLTASHVGAGSVAFSGTTYGLVNGSVHRLHEPGNVAAPADLTMFRINGAPAGMVPITISGSSPPLGGEVLGIGYGRTRASDLTTWYASSSLGMTTWSETPGSGTAFQGYRLGSTGAKSWGLNQVEFSGASSDYGYGNTNYFGMDFSQNGGPNEMQATPGDSGGAMFSKNGGRWELAGIQIGRQLFDGQPGDSVVFGNQSFAADLSLYRSEILDILSTSPGAPAGSVSVPEPSTLISLLGLAAMGLLACLWRRLRR
jgi:PEP-CTERM motif/Trypsin